MLNIFIIPQRVWNGNTGMILSLQIGASFVILILIDTTKYRRRYGMDAGLFTKMLSDKSVTDLKKLKYKYPQADLAEFVSL